MCGVSNGQVLVTVQREERRETRRTGAEAGGCGEGQVRPPGEITESNDCGRGVAFPSVLPFSPVVVGAQPAMTAMAPVARLGKPSRASTSLGSIGLQTTAYQAPQASVLRTDTNGSGSLPFHTSGSLWNHNTDRPRFKRPSPRYTTEVVSAADIPHYQRPSPHPEFLHSSTVWGSWESWLPGHVCQPPILSGHCRAAKFASSIHPAIFFPVAQHRHGPSYLRFLTLQATYKPSSRHIRDKIKSPLS